jgi:2-iminobutanoate/2-iminopropanoate deaminase
MHMKEQITTENAPAAIGPYSQAVTVGKFVFLSGQIPIDPASGLLAGETIEEQAEQVLANIEAILAEAGLDLAAVVKTTVYITDLQEFGKLNAIYEAKFAPFGTFPSRSTVQVGALPKGAAIMVDVIAAKD